MAGGSENVQAMYDSLRAVLEDKSNVLERLREQQADAGEVARLTARLQEINSDLATRFNAYIAEIAQLTGVVMPDGPGDGPVFATMAVEQAQQIASGMLGLVEAEAFRRTVQRRLDAAIYPPLFSWRFVAGLPALLLFGVPAALMTWAGVPPYTESFRTLLAVTWFVFLVLLLVAYTA